MLPQYLFVQKLPPGGHFLHKREERRMTVVEGVPTAVHIGADELPFVDMGGGNLLKVLQVDEQAGLWIIENVFQAGFEVPTHRHTGPVWGYTTSGAWKYEEYDYVNRAGSYLYEPPGSIHTLYVPDDNSELTEMAISKTDYLKQGGSFGLYENADRDLFWAIDAVA